MILDKKSAVMNKTLLSCILFLVVLQGHAQTGWQWGRAGWGTAGGDAMAMTVDIMGNVFLAGPTVDTAASYTIFGSDTIYNHNTQHTNTQLVITKIDAAGNFVWSLGTTGGGLTYASSMSTDISGNLYVACNFADSSTIGAFHFSGFVGNYGLFLAKISPSGVVLWANSVAPNGDIPNGCLGVDMTGNVYLAGDFSWPTLTIGDSTFHNLDPANPDAFLAKYDSSGHPIWARHFGTFAGDEPVALSVTADGHAFVSGWYEADTLDVCGITIIGDTLSYTDDGTSGNNFFAQFDSSGHTIWAQYLSYHLILEASAVDVNHNIYLTGASDTAFVMGSTLIGAAGSSDVVTLKFDSSGNRDWLRVAGGTGNDVAFSISVDNCGKVWLCGRLGYPDPVGYTMYFGSDSLSYTWDTTQVYDPMFMAEYDTSGNYITSLLLPSGSDDFVGMAVDNKGSFYVGGDNLYLHVPLALGPDTLGQNTLGLDLDEYLFAAKYKYSTDACDCNGYPISASFTHTGTSPVSFTYTGTPFYDSLKLDFGDGTSVTGVLSPVHTYMVPGIYHACLYLYSTCLPRDVPYATMCEDINFEDGIPPLSKAEEISVYPNPARNELTISAPGNITEIKITNLLGQTIYCRRSITSGWRAGIDVSALPDGVYFVKVNNCFVRKFVKE